MLNPGKLRKTTQTLKISALVVLASLVTCISNAAQITNATAEAYSGGIYCLPTFYDGNDVLQLDVHQYAGAVNGGSIIGSIYTDDATDPTLTLHHIINNNTGIGWSSYHVSVFMPNIFGIETAGPFAPIVNNPGGWTVSVTAPIAVIGGYQGQVDIFGGPPVAPGGTLDFAYSFTFSNGLAFSFTENVAPGLVPEPSSFAFILAGLAAFGIRKFRKS
jgi:hypothetical protein